VKNTTKDDKWKDKFTQDELKQVQAKLEVLTPWLESNPNATAEEMEKK